MKKEWITGSSEQPTGKKISRRDALKGGARLAGAAVLAGSLPRLIEGCRPRSADAGYDIIIKGGLVYDGGLAPPRRADIGIRGGRIEGIGNLAAGAERTIDASRHIVMPGFIDVHTHCDLTFKDSGKLRYLAYVLPSFKGNYNYISQGVTTVVTGNCGNGYMDIDYWYGLADAVGFGTNVSHLVPHGVMREELFGKNQPRELSSGQLGKMKDRIAEQMEKGAAGMSTGLFYFPGFLAPTKEIVDLCTVVRKYGGVYATHIRDESGKRMPGGGFGDLNSVKEAIEIGERAGVPVEVSHLKLHAPFDGSRVEQVLDLIEAARHRGVEVHADQYPYEAWSCPITDELPEEFRVSGGLKEKYKTREGQKEVKKAAERVFADLPPDKIIVSMFEEDEKLEGKTLTQIAEAEGVSPADVFVRLACAEKPPLDIAFAMRDGDVKKIMARDFVITASDGWTVPKGLTKPHPRCYGTFPRKLRKYVLDGKVLGLQAAIRSMTSLPAEKFRIKDRGRIAEGSLADIAVIDLEKITDRATYMDPHQYPAGVDYVIVNGVISVEGGKATGDRAGKCLRRA